MWIIETWDKDSSLPLLIICRKGEADNVVNRIRVRLSKVRKTLKNLDERNVKQFGFTSTKFDWTLDDGSECEAVALEYVFERRHNFKQIASGIF